MPIETIIIEFQTDVSQLTAGEAKIAESMKKVNVELSKQQQELGREEATMSKLTASLGKLTGESKKGVEQLLKLSGKEVVAGFDKLGLSVDDYVASLKGAEKETKKFGDVTESGRTRLRAMREELLKLAEQGKHNTQRFKELQQAAGKLDDEIRDVQQRIKATGSDTRVFDGLLNAAQGVAGGFAVAQGAAALFGDESEELQETLLRVNAAMAILQGLQQLGQVLQKESAASLLLLNTQRKIEVVQTNLATAAESKNIVVRGLATAAQWLLNAAMTANPIGIVITALVAISAALIFFTSRAREAAIEQGKLNAALDSAGILLDAEVEGYENANRRIVSDLKLRGADEAAILRAELNNRKLTLTATEREIAKLRKSINESGNADRIEATKRLEELERNAAKQRVDIYVDENEARKKLNEDQNELSEKIESDRVKKAKKRHDDNIKFAAERIAKEQERIEQEIAGFQLEQIGLDKTEDKWKKLEAAINSAKAALANLTQEGNKAKLALAEAAEANKKLLVQTVSAFQTEEEKDAERTAKVQELAQKRIDSNVNVNQHTVASAKQTSKFVLQWQEMTDKERLELALQTAAQITSIFAEAFRNQTENQLRQVDADRKRIEDLQEQGAISAKEAERRMKFLDEKERQIKTKGAQRDKQIAIFQAFIATAAAVAKALPNVVLAAIAGALGAAQIALIAARPIPKFGKGKKSLYEGLAEVGETGAELIERNGHMQVASKRQITWLSKEDKVYSPLETARMIESMPVMGKVPQTFSKGAKGFSIDYDRMGKSIAKHLPENNISFDKDGFNLSIRKGQETLKYLDKRRKF